MSKSSSASCQVIEVGRMNYRVSLGAQTIRPHMIAYDEDDIGFVHGHIGEIVTSTIKTAQGDGIANFNISATFLSPSSEV